MKKVVGKLLILLFLSACNVSTLEARADCIKVCEKHNGIKAIQYSKISNCGYTTDKWGGKCVCKDGFIIRTEDRGKCMKLCENNGGICEIRVRCYKCECNDGGTIKKCDNGFGKTVVERQNDQRRTYRIFETKLEDRS